MHRDCTFMDMQLFHCPLSAQFMSFLQKLSFRSNNSIVLHTVFLQNESKIEADNPALAVFTSRGNQHSEILIPYIEGLCALKGVFLQVFRLPDCFHSDMILSFFRETTMLSGRQGSWNNPAERKLSCFDLLPDVDNANVGK